MNHQPVVVWRLAHHTITAGTSWLQIATEQGIVASFRKKEQLASLRNSLRSAEAMKRASRNTARAFIAREGVEFRYLPAGGCNIVLAAGNHYSIIPAEADLGYWLDLCLADRPSLLATLARADAGIELRDATLTITSEEASTTLRPDPAALAAYLFDAAATTAPSELPLYCADGTTLYAFAAGVGLNFLGIDGEASTLASGIGRGRATHLAMTALDAGQHAPASTLATGDYR